MQWPPSYITMHQGTSIHGNIMFKTGNLIAENGDNLMDCINKKCNHDHNNNANNKPKEVALITEDDKLLITENDKVILI